jgi:hypothetical protein
MNGDKKQKQKRFILMLSVSGRTLGEMFFYLFMWGGYVAEGKSLNDLFTVCTWKMCRNC